MSGVYVCGEGNDENKEHFHCVTSSHYPYPLREAHWKATLTCFVDFKNTCYRGFPGGPGRTHMWCGGTSMGRSHARRQLSPCPTVTAPTHLEHTSCSCCSPCHEARGLAPRFRSPCSRSQRKPEPSSGDPAQPKKITCYYCISEFPCEPIVVCFIFIA